LESPHGALRAAWQATKELLIDDFRLLIENPGTIGSSISNQQSSINNNLYESLSRQRSTQRAF
jgi:hypothetical protein